jgi:glycosyltransferase involved in cell wall biosynthesis
MLKRLLLALEGQATEERFTYSIVVADNDRAESARATVAAFAGHKRLQVSYCLEQRQNIALARNTALQNANGDFIAFIDDDEFPITEWLLNLYHTLEGYGVDGVLGPVLPHFDEEPPRWVRKGGFFNRPRHQTGFLLSWTDCRTGNVLFRAKVLELLGEPFRHEFGSGGEDLDFFQRAITKGCGFVWCDGAIVYEVQEPSRWEIRLMVRRALLRGRNNWRYTQGRWLRLAKSAVALPLYTLSLPIMLLGGYHRFVKSLVRIGDHGGKILAALGVNPVRTRNL